MAVDTYAHFERHDVVAEYASFDFLLPPEAAILSRLRGELEGARILDIGVGGGRTTNPLASLASRYVGTDVSRSMIRACRRRFSDRAGVSFLVADARDMGSLPDAGFDFVFFSFNGLDVVGEHEDRLRATAEMRRVCRPGGHVCFSSHNLAFAQASFSALGSIGVALRAGASDSVVAKLRAIRWGLARSRAWRRLNPEWRRIAGSDHAMILEERPRYEFESRHYRSPGEAIHLRKYYVRPVEQVRRLVSTGLEDVRVFAPDGAEVTAKTGGGLRRHWWLYYLGKRAGDAEAPAGGDREAPAGGDPEVGTGRDAGGPAGGPAA